MSMKSVVGDNFSGQHEPLSHLYKEINELMYIWFSSHQMNSSRGANDSYNQWLHELLFSFETLFNIDTSIKFGSMDLALSEFFKRKAKFHFQDIRLVDIIHNCALVLNALKIHTRIYDSRFIVLLRNFCDNLEIDSFDVLKKFRAIKDTSIGDGGGIEQAGTCLALVDSSPLEEDDYSNGTISQYLVCNTKVSTKNRLYESQYNAIQIALATIVGGISLSVASSITTPMVIVNALSLLKLQIILNNFTKVFSMSVFEGITHVLTGLLSGHIISPSLAGLFSNEYSLLTQSVVAVIGGSMAAINMKKRLDRRVSIHLEHVFPYQEKDSDNLNSKIDSKLNLKVSKAPNRCIMLLINGHVSDDKSDIDVWKTTEPEECAPKSHNNSAACSAKSKRQIPNCDDGNSNTFLSREFSDEFKTTENPSKNKLVDWDIINLTASRLWQPVSKSYDVRLLRWCDSKTLNFANSTPISSIKKTFYDQLLEKSFTSLSIQAAAICEALTWPQYIFGKINDIDNPWIIHRKKADDAGKLLATILLNSTKSQATFSENGGNGIGFDDDTFWIDLGKPIGRSITLVGYGFGARVIFQSLLSLQESNDPNALGLIENVYLLGAPIGVSEKEWSQARMMVAGRFVNGYSKNDYTLATIYRYWSWDIRIAGLQAIEIGDNNISSKSDFRGQGESESFFQRIFRRKNNLNNASNGVVLSSYVQPGESACEGASLSSSNDVVDNQVGIDDSYVWIDAATVVSSHLIENFDLSHLVRSQQDYAEQMDKIIKLIKLV